MKKFAAILMIAVASTTALVGCSGGGNDTTVESVVQKAPLQDLLNQMIESGAVRMPMPADETIAKEVFKIDSEIVSEYAIAQTGISPGVGLIVMAKANEGQVDAVKANMDAVLEEKVGQAFYPDEVEAAKAGEVVVDGDYVALFILDESVKEATITMFKESVAE